MINITNQLNLPKEYKRSKEKLPEMGFPTRNGSIYRMQNSGTSAVVLACIVPEEVSMPFENPARLSQDLRESLLKEVGLIELNMDKNKKGHLYTYYIIKQHIQEYPGNYYMLNLNIKVGKNVYFINACFDEIGTTGMRDSIVFESLSRNGNSQEVLANWACDPYDSSYREGFLMNQSERKEFDDAFPEHPLTIARKLVEYVIENN